MSDMEARITREKNIIEKISAGRFMISAAALQAADFASETSLWMTASARAAARGSGDAAAACGLPDGSLAFILSDGMGRGMKAAAESAPAVRKLRRMLKDGLAAREAIKTLNLYMIDKNGDSENFATIDMAIINKNTGRADFYKMGAAASFLARGGRVRRIEAPALPAGILSQASLAHTTLQLAAGDVVVMVSDGIAEADRDDYRARWLEAMLCAETATKTGPRVLARRIAAAAGQRRKGAEADDSTVIVVKIC